METASNPELRIRTISYKVVQFGGIGTGVRRPEGTEPGIAWSGREALAEFDGEDGAPTYEDAEGRILTGADTMGRSGVCRYEG